ncbi:MAG TPA: CoA pyrophosphatase [Burkholderiales bacterium]|nr:CoA pyrophosphatase [Burkholderiales bacterium]
MASQQLTRTHGRVFPLTQEGIAEALSRPAPSPEPDDLHVIALQEGTRVTEAAVLVPLIDRSGRVQVLFTQRTAHLDDHAGQISFPGGRVEASDASREETALRELEEEIGLASASVAVLGRLPEYEIPSGFRITPVVGWIETPFALNLDPFEVAAVFEAPLEHFLDAARYQRRQFRFRGRHRHYLAIPFEGRYIWGATAGMLYNLCRLLQR